MFFEASKIAWFVFTPSTFLSLLLLIGALCLLFNFVDTGRRAVIYSTFGFLLCGFSPLGHLLLLPLESRFPIWTGTTPPAGIIVLGGSSDTTVSAARGQVALNESAERFTESAALARRFPTAKLIFTGGDGGFLGGGGNESDDAQVIFNRAGVPSSQITYERAARNTHENAVETAKLINQKPAETWLLVTSAFHMPRAVGSFQKAGVQVTPYPVDFRTRNYDDMTRPFASLSEGLRRVDIAAKEWIGLLVYTLNGYTSSFFPG